jgi:GNAT superfamily N-acetyltransferase
MGKTRPGGGRRSRPPRAAPAVVIRPVGPRDRAGWESLWRGYQRFYERTLPARVTAQTWARLIRGEHLFGALALGRRGKPVGLVHYLFHPATSTLGQSCYLPDLFVAPAARGQGIGRKLIASVAEAARTRGAAVLYWQTEEFNGPARRLYERVAKRSPFIRYQIDLATQQ